MTQILTANIGSYPRIGEEKDYQRLRRALHHLQNKEISSHAFHDVEQSVIHEIIREQLASDIDEVTDGLVSWHDPVSHFSRKVTGIKLTGLQRFFDTNTYYRVPVFTGKPRRKPTSITADFVYAQKMAYKPIRSVLTGPYTLAQLSQAENRSFATVKSRVAFFTDLIRSEVRSLVRNGAKIIQVDEPAFPRFPEDISLFRPAIQAISDVIKPARLVLAFYFSPLAPVMEQLQSLPADQLQLDFTYDGKKLLEKLTQNPPTQTLGFGLLNGRNTRLEAIDPIIRLLKTYIEKANPKTIYLTPSCGLEHLPRAIAFEKLKLLAKIKGEMDAKEKIASR